MTTDVEKLVVQLSADIKQYQREMQRAQGVANAQARAIENRYRQMDKRLGQIGSSAARSLIAPLTGVAAAISAREVLAYADAWTSAKNSLAVAGIVGANQADVLDRLYESAQANATPIGALADLFGKAQQASDNLGASQADLLKFSDGVATSLRVAGTSAAAASGALTQLGQLLGSARVQAEEFNSINDGARPILMAVAAGLDAAGGSVSKLKALVNDGKVSGQQFFQAFLRGLPQIEKMAANATQTIDQGITKVNNAFTRYIGETDASLGASQRLIAGLNALADEFDKTADLVLKIAGVIAGALVGRSIGLMIAKLGLATVVVGRFVAALRAATTMGGLATAIGGLSAAAGPLGLVIGGTVVGALALFSSSSDTAGAGADRFAERLRRMGEEADKAAEKTKNAGGRINDVLVNDLTSEVGAADETVKAATQSVMDLFDALFANVDRDTISPEQLRQLEDLRDKLKDGGVSADDANKALFALANSNPNFQALANAFRPLLENLSQVIAAAQQARSELAAASGATLSPEQIAGYRQYGQSRQQGEEMLRLGKAYADEAARQNGLSKEQLAVEKEIAAIKKDLAAQGGFLSDSDVRDLAMRNVAADQARSKSGGKTAGVKQTADSRFDGDIQAVRDRTAALVEEQRIIGLSYRAQEERRMSLDLEQSALADLREEARRKGQTDLENVKLSDAQVARIREASAAYAEQADALRLVQEAQQRADDAAADFYDTFKSEAMDAITGAKSLGDALANVAKKLGEMALSGAFDMLFAPQSGSSGGGVLGSLFNAIGGMLRADGGPVKKGQPYIVGEKRAELFVPEQNGTIVPKLPTAPKMEKLSAPRAGGDSINFAPSYSIDARGADQAAVDRLERGLARTNAELEARVVKIVRSRPQKGW